MRCEVLAIGTELLLGQIVDTNSTWIGEQLADAGIDSFEHRQVGDNLGRMVQALRELLDRSDAVIVCGGLGPTPDDMTRQAIADVMGVELERREDLVEWVSALFTSRGRATTSRSWMHAVPEVGGRKQVSMRTVVVFPAPLGPRNPTISPCATSKETPRTASRRPYRLVSSRAMMAG